MRDSSAKDRRGRKRKARQAAQVCALGLLTLLAVLAAASGGVAATDRLGSLVSDLFQRLKPRQPAGAPVIIIDIDEASIRQIGQWPWPRTTLARLVEHVGQMGPAGIAFDLVFAEPDRTSLRQAASNLIEAGAEVRLPANLPDNDAVLANAFSQTPVTAGLVLSNQIAGELPDPKTGFAVAGRNPEQYLTAFTGGLANLKPLNDAAAGLGFFSFPPSPDGILRDVPLVALGGNKLYPSLAVEALRLAQNAGSIVIRATGGSGEADTGRPAMTALKVGAFEVPTGPAGELRVYYSGVPGLTRLSASQFLGPEVAPSIADRVRGRIVLVGSSAIGLRDIVATPLSPAVPGVEVHAEIIDQIVSGSFLTRPDWAPGAEIAVCAFLTIALLAALLLFGPLIAAGAAVTLVGIAVAGAWLAFDHSRLLLNPIVPSISVLSVYSTATVLLLLLSDRERQFVRRAFGQYLAPTLVEKLADNPTALKLGGEVRELTVLFCDIRHFTALSENLDPQDVTKLLNRFFTPMTDILLRSGATIDKYVGDQIMAFWNAPLATPDHPHRACFAVLEMIKGLADLNTREPMQIDVGIGLSTGPCCVGNLGSEQRFSYSAIGDTVNIAARLEGLTKQLRIAFLLTETTAKRVQNLPVVELDLVCVVGRREPLSVFTVLPDDSLHGRNFASFASSHASMLAAYRTGNFLLADRLLTELRFDCPPVLTHVYEVYAERLSNLRQNPPGEWNGVFNALQK
jgi:adenylate cyclase